MLFETDTACVAGAKHEAAGTEGQDAIAAVTTPTAAVIAVADGAGSRPLSHFGAEAAVRHAVAYAAMFVHYEDLDAVARNALHAAARALDGPAEGLGVTPRDLHSTLSLAILSERRVVIASVGDGVHVVRSRDGSITPRAMAPEKEYANVTDFLTHPDLDEVIEVYSTDAADVDAVLLSSDGLDPLLLRGPENDRWASGTAHFLIDATAFGLWRRRDYERLFCSPQVRERTDDDCCLAIGRRAPSLEGAIEVVLGRGARAHARDETRWPGGRRAWRILESAGLHVVESALDADALSELARRPVVLAAGVESPLICWPSDVALDEVRDAFGAVMRHPLGTGLDEEWRSCRSDRESLAAGAARSVAALHDAEFAHGSLRRELFTVDRHGTVTLADPLTALEGGPRGIAARRDRDIRFVEHLAAQAAKAAPSKADGSEEMPIVPAGERGTSESQEPYDWASDQRTGPQPTRPADVVQLEARP